MVEFETGKAVNVKLLQFFEMAVVLRNSDVSIFIIQFHGINVKTNVEFKLRLMLGKCLKFSHDFTLW